MTCKTVQRAINERLPEDPDGLPSDIAGHLAGCPACQSYAACVAGIGSVLAQCRARAAALPESDLLAVRERIAEAVAARHSAPPARCRPAFPASADPLLAWGSGLAALLAAAFIGVLAWPRGPRVQQPCGGAVERDGVPEAQTLSPEPLSTKLAATLDEPRTPTAEPCPTNLTTKLDAPELAGLPAFRAEYEALKASGKGIGPGFLQRLARYLEGPSRTVDERLDGWELLTEAFEEAGELHRSVQAYGNYLEAVESSEGRERAVAIGRRRADRLFNIAHDEIKALAHYELLAVRYPDTELPFLASLRCGEYYQKNRLWREAEQGCLPAFRDKR